MITQLIKMPKQNLFIINYIINIVLILSPYIKLTKSNYLCMFNYIEVFYEN